MGLPHYEYYSKEFTEWFDRQKFPDGHKDRWAYIWNGMWDRPADRLDEIIAALKEADDVS